MNLNKLYYIVEKDFRPLYTIPLSTKVYWWGYSPNAISDGVVVSNDHGYIFRSPLFLGKPIDDSI